MIDFLRFIFESIQNLGQLIVGVFRDFAEGIINLFSYVKSAFSFVYTALNLLPVYYLVFGSIIITVLIIYILLGRQSGGD